MSDVRESIAAYGATVRKWTVAEYYRAAEKGIFKPGERLELIEGEVVEKVSPQQSRNAAAITMVSEELRTALATVASLRIQLPVRLDNRNEPEPDVLAVSPRDDHYADAHPAAKDVVLAVEIADTSLHMDRGVKAALYARFGVPEYWVVNLRDNQVEVFREPSSSGYRLTEVKSSGETIAPIAAPQAQISVARLLP